VSARNHKAIFERKGSLDHWVDQQQEWEEVCREWIYLEPFALFGQRQEFIDSSQITVTRKQRAAVTYSPTMATVTTDCRLKIRKPVTVDEDEPEHDTNYRIFHIENIVNVREQNRELELMVIERV
jgi:hypothetical protein